jgi:hypothetical protein
MQLLRKVSRLAKKSKIILAVALILLVSLLSANLSAAPMHHMDTSDCTMQVSCNNCYISASLNSPTLNIFPSFCGELLETTSLFESLKSVPSTPPPKI